MTVKQLIDILNQFSEDMEVMDASYLDIVNVYQGTWVDTNYPYNKPDKQVIIID